MRVYQPTTDEADRFPRAMLEGSTEFDWAELPENLKDVLRAAARKINEWADPRSGVIAGEIVPESHRALPQANLLPHITHLEAVVTEHVREVIAVHQEYGEEAWCPACLEHWPCRAVEVIE